MAVLEDFEDSLADAKPQGFDEWALVELMGHRQFAGRVTEQVIAGRGFVRIEVPAVAGRDGFTKLVGTGSVYSITPVEEPVARVIAGNLQDPPIDPWQLEERPHLAVCGADDDDLGA